MVTGPAIAGARVSAGPYDMLVDETVEEKLINEVSCDGKQSAMILIAQLTICRSTKSGRRIPLFSMTWS